MSELVVFKANELAVSRYDLTEHETKLILCCVALLNPTLKNPSREERTVSFTYQQYAKMMGISRENAYGTLAKSTRYLMTRTVEIQDPLVKGFEIFQWANYAKFSSEKLEIVFSEEILPYLFQLKQFIKYNLEHVKAFENKYSMRVYEWLLKEITQKKTHRANIEININDFKFMLMLEKKYKDLRDLNKKILKLVEKDLNTYSNMKLTIAKRGRPADTLIFQCELDKQVDLIAEQPKDPIQVPDSSTRTPIPEINYNPDKWLYNGLKKLLNEATITHIKLSKFELDFLNDMQEKYNLNGSFSWLTNKQRDKLEKILLRYRM